MAFKSILVNKQICKESFNKKNNGNTWKYSTKIYASG